MHPVLWILLVFSAIGATLDINDLQEMGCFELRKRLEVDAIQLPFKVEEHLMSLFAQIASKCQLNAFMLARNIRSWEEVADKLEVPLIKDKDEGPTALQAITATLERMVGFSTKIVTLKGLGLDTQVNAVLEGIDKAAPDPQFELWRTSELLGHLKDEGNAVNLDEARRIAFPRALALFPPSSDRALELLRSQMTDGSPLAPGVASKASRLFGKFSDEDFLQFFTKLNQYIRPFVAVLLQEAKTEQLAKVSEALGCDLPIVDAEVKYMCLRVARKKGDMARAIELGAEVLGELRAPHPLQSLKEEYMFLVSKLGSSDQDTIRKIGGGLQNAPPEIRKSYGIEYLIDVLSKEPDAINNIRGLGDRIELLRLVPDRYVLRNAYISIRDDPAKKLEIVSDITGRELFKNAHGSFFRTCQAFFEKCMQVIVSTLNTISAEAMWLRRTSQLKPNLRRETLAAGRFAFKAHRPKLIPLEDDKFLLVNIPPWPLPRLVHTRGQISAATVTMSAEQKLSKIAPSTSLRRIQYPKVFTKGMIEKIRGTMDSGQLGRMLTFEAVRNPTTTNAVRYDLVLELIDINPDDSASLVVTGEPYQLSWLGKHAGRIAYQEIFNQPHSYLLLTTLDKYSERYPGHYRYWSNFLSTGYAEFYAGNELRLRKELKASGVASIDELKKLPDKQFLFNHRQALTTAYGRATAGQEGQEGGQTVGKFDCQVVEELNRLWHGFCNIEFALPCSEYKKSASLNKLLRATTLSHSEADNLRKEAQKIDAERMALWKSVFANITEDGLAKALESVPQDLLAAAEEIPVQSSIWKDVPEVLKGITTLPEKDLEERKKRLYDFALRRVSESTPWLAVAALSIDYPAKDKKNFEKPLVAVAGKFAAPLSDPRNPHEGIKMLREILLRMFHPAPSGPKTFDYGWNTSDKQLRPIADSISLRILEEVPDKQMTAIGTIARRITELMSLNATKAIEIHWKKYLDANKYTKTKLMPVLQKLEDPKHWGNLMNMIPLEDMETIVRSTSDGLPPIAHLCSELANRLGTPKYKPQCSVDSPFFQLVRIIAAIDAEGQGFEKCLSTRYKAFMNLGQACSILSHTSEDPLDPIRQLEFQRSEPPKGLGGPPGGLGRPPGGLGGPPGGLGSPPVFAKGPGVSAAPTEVDIVPVDGFWVPRVMRTLYAAFFHLYEAKDWDVRQAYIEAKSSLIEPVMVSIMRALLGVDNYNTPEAATRLARLQWHRDRLRYTKVDPSEWPSTNIRPFFSIRSVPEAPVIYEKYRMQLLLLEARELRHQELESALVYEKRMNICELKALSPVGGDKPPVFDASFTTSMRRRIDHMIQRIEINTYRDILMLVLQYTPADHERIAKELLAGPGRLRSFVSRYGTPDQLKKTIAWLAHETVNGPLPDDKAVEALRRAFLSRGFSEKIQEEASKDYPDIFGAAKGDASSGGPPPLPGMGGPPPFPGMGGPPPFPGMGGPPPFPGLGDPPS